MVRGGAGVLRVVPHEVPLGKLTSGSPDGQKVKWGFRITKSQVLFFNPLLHDDHVGFILGEGLEGRVVVIEIEGRMAEKVS